MKEEVGSLGDGRPVRNFLNASVCVGDNIGAKREVREGPQRIDPFSLSLELSCRSSPVDFVEVGRYIGNGRSFVWT
jgi:hypothetical protein